MFSRMSTVSFGLPEEATVSAPTRSSDDVLGNLRALHAAQANTRAELDDVRRQQDRLTAHEADLLWIIARRADKIDRALDEYATAKRTEMA